MPNLISPTGKPITVRPVRPNVGIEAAYRGKIVALLREMSADVTREIERVYLENPPALAQDAPDGGGGGGTFWATPAWSLHRLMKRLTDKWTARFDDASPGMAKSFVGDAASRTDAGFRSALKRAGFVVSFRMTEEQKDVIQAAVNQNSTLIKSIGQEYLSQVQGAVMRSVSAGRDIKGLTQELRDRFGVSQRKAAFIARDQNNKATGAITKIRQKECGLLARWMHTGGAKHPRRLHVQADGKVYDPSEGCLIDGRYIWPGEDINCGCVALSVIPGSRRDRGYAGMPGKLKKSALERAI